ncbi:MAG: M48 family metalloprotease, partial [Dehalococcoidia bacterium]|nr:M48 family metalloprotease [Dehalococcoidia bacterium]
AGIKVTHDDYPYLFNVVEEMKIASGLERMPDIYIVQDKAMNAFSTGARPDTASILVTTGLLKTLSRDQLQGVIGHEIAHIKNRDVLLMSVCSIMLGIITVFHSYVRNVINSTRYLQDRYLFAAIIPPPVIVAIVAVLALLAAPLVSPLIHLCISRRREYLADACAALYTRYPEGLASALELLGRPGWRLISANASNLPMYIVNPFNPDGNRPGGHSRTHPPLWERIHVLRTMVSGASFADYNTAWGRVHHGEKPVISGADVAMAGTAALRESTDEQRPDGEPVREKIARAREVSNVLLGKKNFRVVPCACGATWKIPPDFTDRQVLCVRCGKMVEIPK